MRRWQDDVEIDGSEKHYSTSSPFDNINYCRNKRTRLVCVRSILRLARDLSYTSIVHNKCYESTRLDPYNTMKFPGSCYCRVIKYEIELDDKDQARTSICHCGNCKVSWH